MSKFSIFVKSPICIGSNFVFGVLTANMLLATQRIHCRSMLKQQKLGLDQQCSLREELEMSHESLIVFLFSAD